MSRPRLPLAAIASLAAAGLLVVGLFLSWWSGPLEIGDYRIRLHAMDLCMGDRGCHSMGLANAGENAVLWSRLGTAVMGASVVSALLLLWSAIGALRHVEKSVMPWIASALCLFSAALSALFVATHPEFGDLTPGYGMVCTFVGAGVGAASARLIYARSSGSS